MVLSVLFHFNCLSLIYKSSTILKSIGFKIIRKMD